jgi:hypothetical protein
MSNKILKLHPEDNVAVLTADLKMGTEITLLGKTFSLTKDLSLGDKIALAKLEKGALIYKYGIAIGSTKTSVELGEWVHLHNIQSDYVPTYVFDGSDEEK